LQSHFKELKDFPEDIELYIDIPEGKEIGKQFTVGMVSDTFENDHVRNESIYLTHISPNILDECKEIQDILEQYRKEPIGSDHFL
jgi:hypothetical protein